MSLFNPSRDQVRQFFFETWAKYQQQSALTDLEKIALEVIQLHPEYQAILSKPTQFASQEYFPEMGETNPFLHLSLHLSVIEQISINQPTGISQIYETLKAKHHDKHPAQHAILECLAETIWQAQRNKTPLDSEHYLNLLQNQLE
ncbi:MAG: DUF1841 family protein [Methylophilaceae bacterium]